MLNFLKPEKNEEGLGVNDLSGEELGVLEEIGGRLLKLGSTTVKEIMIPRIDIVSVSLEATFEEIVEVITQDGHSRIPVYRQTVDDIIGLLYVKDLLRYICECGNVKGLELEKILREPSFVPETKKVLVLMKEIQVEKNHLSIVVDEYGGVSGIVCLEDILEEIVGEIHDEYDREEVMFKKEEGGGYWVDSRMTLEDLKKDLGVELKNEEVETVGGFLFHLFERIPEEGEEIEYEGIRFRVKLTGNRISEVRMRMGLDAKDG